MRIEKSTKTKKDAFHIYPFVKDELIRLSNETGIDMSDIMILGANMILASDNPREIIEEYKKELGETLEREFNGEIDEENLVIFSFRMPQLLRERFGKAKRNLKVSGRIFFSAAVYVASKFLSEIIEKMKRNETF